MSIEGALSNEFLAADAASRRNAVEQLSRQLQQQPSATGQILCHRPCALYVLLPVSLAKRLLRALSMDSEAQATA